MIFGVLHMHTTHGHNTLRSVIPITTQAVVDVHGGQCSGQCIGSAQPACATMTSGAYDHMERGGFQY